MKEVQINGTTYPLFFGSAGMNEFLGHRPLSELQEVDFDKRITYNHTLQITYIALKEGARKAGTPFTLTFEDVCDLVDEHPSLIEESMTAFSGSIQGDQGNGKKPKVK